MDRRIIFYSFEIKDFTTKIINLTEYTMNIMVKKENNISVLFYSLLKFAIWLLYLNE